MWEVKAKEGAEVIKHGSDNREIEKMRIGEKIKYLRSKRSSKEDFNYVRILGKVRFEEIRIIVEEEVLVYTRRYIYTNKK